MKNFWDERFSGDGFAYGTAPNDFLVQASAYLKNGGTILSIGEGEGRNAVFLAGLGHVVTAIDQSEVGLAKARKLAAQSGHNIATVTADLATFDFGADKYDAIISIFCHLPSALRKNVHAKIKHSLKKGGVFITELYSPEQIKNDTGGPKDADMLVTLDELIADFSGFELLQGKSINRDVTEGEFHKGIAAVTQYVGRR